MGQGKSTFPGKKGRAVFSDVSGRKRYLAALLMILAMVGVSEFLGEKEIIFPEMAALAIGMWIVDKRVWRVGRIAMIVMMTSGATWGVVLVRYSALPLMVNLALAFSFAAAILLLMRASLIPLLSACMLPVVLQTESWVYPIAVSVMSVILVIGQGVMEKYGLRKKIIHVPVGKDRKKEIVRWGRLLFSWVLIAFFPVYTSNLYCILPPLVVTYVEFANSKSGFRNRPVQIYLLLVTAAVLGSVSQFVGYVLWELPESMIACVLFLCLFTLFELSGKFFAPAGAVALIPMIIPAKDLLWFPFQIAVGTAVFIGVAMLFFLKCYKWPKSHLIVCMLPTYLRRIRKRRTGKRVVRETEA